VSFTSAIAIAPEVSWGERQINRPPPCEPGFNRDLFYPKTPRPGSCGHAFSAISDQSRATRVDALLPWSRPSDVSRLVVAIIVDAVDRMALGWPWTYVREKRFKGIDPFLSNRDTSAAIVREFRNSSVEASGLDPDPRLVFGRSGMSVSVVGHEQAWKQAAARLWLTPSKSVIASLAGLSAIASAPRPRSLADGRAYPDNHQPADAITDWQWNLRTPHFIRIIPWFVSL
jgi:hypothetical protein